MAISTDPVDLQAVVGAQHVHLPGPKDGIDGAQPTWVVEPGSIEEAAAVLRLAHGRGLAVAPRGGGSKIDWGNIPRHLDLILSTRRMDRVLEHAAGDLVTRVEAGARLETVQRTLQAEGQWLALDPPEQGATIGGIIATNASGPHRLRYGTVRDQLIGLTYILPDGTIAHAGGRVVKNVAGYDLCKLFTGSLGTLGLIVEAIFRLHPLPEASRTVLLIRRGAGNERVLEQAAGDMLRSQLEPAMMDFTTTVDYALAASFEGSEAGVVAQERAARDLWRTHGVQEGPQDGMPVWMHHRKWIGHSAPPYPVRLKLAAPPTQLAGVVADIGAAGPEDGRIGHIAGHAGSGVTYVDLWGNAQELVQAIRHLRADIARRGGSVVVLEAPIDVKVALDVWGEVGDALPLMRRVKERFDPQNTMNPGRFVGRL